MIPSQIPVKTPVKLEVVMPWCSSLLPKDTFDYMQSCSEILGVPSADQWLNPKSYPSSECT